MSDCGQQHFYSFPHSVTSIFLKLFPSFLHPFHPTWSLPMQPFYVSNCLVFVLSLGHSPQLNVNSPFFSSSSPYSYFFLTHLHFDDSRVGICPYPAQLVDSSSIILNFLFCSCGFCFNISLVNSSTPVCHIFYWGALRHFQFGLIVLSNFTVCSFTTVSRFPFVHFLSTVQYFSPSLFPAS